MTSEERSALIVKYRQERQLSYKQIGIGLGITKERVRQIYLKELRVEEAREDVKDAQQTVDGKVSVETPIPLLKRAKMISVRLGNACLNHDIHTLGELIDVGEQHFLKMSNCGRKCWNEVQQFQKELGLLDPTPKPSQRGGIMTKLNLILERLQTIEADIDQIKDQIGLAKL